MIYLASCDRESTLSPPRNLPMPLSVAKKRQGSTILVRRKETVLEQPVIKVAKNGIEKV